MAAEILNEILTNQTQNIYELHTTSKWDLSQVWKPGSAFQSQLMSSIPSAR